jgi:glycosyltransferase involved in cell wall biosynthesis
METSFRPVPLAPFEAEPLVSVLIANHDYGRFLPEALDSVRAQTYDRLEVVVCDDASTDDSVDVVARFAGADPRIRLVRHDEVRGQGGALNTAFAAAAGDVICLLDADDRFDAGKVGRVVEAFGRDGDGILVHPLTMVDGEGRPIQRIPSFTTFERGWLGPRVVARGGRWRWVPTSGVSLRRGVAELIFPMPEEGFISSADTFLLILAPMLTPVAVIEDVLGAYRRHGANAYARERFDPARTESAADNLRRSIDEVNERLVELGGDRPRLRVGDNLRYLELDFMRTLISGHDRRPVLVRRYSALMARLVKDDLYGGLQKGWAAVMYLAAVALPVSVRGRWLSLSLMASPAKELARRLLGPSRAKVAER